VQKDANELVFNFLSKHHIRVAPDFDAVFKRGTRLTDRCVALYFLKTQRDYPRLGMVISKRNCARAVDRNRIKRLIREQFRLNQHVISAVDVVVSLRSSSNNVSDQELSECIKKLFSQFIAQCDGSSSN
jgi:ribonuclease P protein component